MRAIDAGRLTPTVRLGTASLWLKISAVIELLFAIGHTLGGQKDWSPMGDNEVLRTMRQVHFDFLGVNRSYFDFYQAFGYLLSVGMILQAILLWQVSGLAATDTKRAQPMIAVFLISTVISGFIAWRLLFPAPVWFSVVLVATLAMSLMQSTARPTHLKRSTL